MVSTSHAGHDRRLRSRLSQGGTTKRRQFPWGSASVMSKSAAGEQGLAPEHTSVAQCRGSRTSWPPGSVSSPSCGAAQPLGGCGYERQSACVIRLSALRLARHRRYLHRPASQGAACRQRGSVRKQASLTGATLCPLAFSTLFPLEHSSH